MNTNEIIKKLKELKPIYQKEGFIILGLFGSYARKKAKENSDIDILYDINDSVFLKKYKGFLAISKLTDIKEELKSIFHKNIDIADITTLNRVGKKYILKDTIYV